MKFRTEISLAPSAHKVDHQQHVLAIGSCFAERIGHRLGKAKFSATVNPLGIAYHPLALLRHMEIAAGCATLSAPLVRAALWHSFDLHSSFSRLNKAEFDANVAAGIASASEGIDQADWLILTWGSAWGYRRKDEGEIVANCHKYPADFFQKELATVEEIVAGYSAFFQQQSPDQRVILTVSPVRHIKDGISQNALSKATLRLACHQLSEAFDQVHYFPAYELLIDDLRDYRFYADDLVHPSLVAEQYIWEGFGKCFFSPDTQKLIRQWTKLQKAFHHRPLQPASDAYRVFLEKLQQDLIGLSGTLNCEGELQEVAERLKAFS